MVLQSTPATHVLNAESIVHGIKLGVIHSSLSLESSGKVDIVKHRLRDLGKMPHENICLRASDLGSLPPLPARHGLLCQGCEGELCLQAKPWVAGLLGCWVAGLLGCWLGLTDLETTAGRERERERERERAALSRSGDFLLVSQAPRRNAFLLLLALLLGASKKPKLDVTQISGPKWHQRQAPAQPQLFNLEPHPCSCNEGQPFYRT